MSFDVKDLCQETVLVDGARQACGRPLNARGGCEYASRHLED